MTTSQKDLALFAEFMAWKESRQDHKTVSETVKKCGATTQKGTKCLRKATKNGRCSMHPKTTKSSSKSQKKVAANTEGVKANDFKALDTSLKAMKVGESVALAAGSQVKLLRSNLRSIGTLTYVQHKVLKDGRKIAEHRLDAGQREYQVHSAKSSYRAGKQVKIGVQSIKRIA